MGSGDQGDHKKLEQQTYVQHVRPLTSNVSQHLGDGDARRNFLAPGGPISVLKPALKPTTLVQNIGAFSVTHSNITVGNDWSVL